MEPKTNVHVALLGKDGNSMAIIGRTRAAMRRAGVDSKTIKEYTEEATSGDYDHLLQTTMKFVHVL